MSDPDRLDQIVLRLDAISQDIRKQGRASVAAQAAAETCLEGVRALQDRLPPPGMSSEPHQEPTEREELADVVGALLPFADALDRAVEQARGSAVQPQPASWLARWLGLAPAPSSGLSSIAGGLELLQQQLRSTFQELGVEIESRVGIPVDGDVHRVVEVRQAPDVPPNTVIAVVRPGYSVGGARLREAEVVASSREPAGLPVSRREVH